MLVILYYIHKYLGLCIASYISDDDSMSNRYTYNMFAEILTEADHLSQLQKLIWPARSKYSNLGLEMGIKPDTIDAIEKSNHYKVDECFKAVLQEALRSEVPLTKHNLVNALRSSTVGFGKLASEVSQMNFGKSAYESTSVNVCAFYKI